MLLLLTTNSLRALELVALQYAQTNLFRALEPVALHQCLIVSLSPLTLSLPVKITRHIKTQTKNQDLIDEIRRKNPLPKIMSTLGGEILFITPFPYCLP